MTTRALERYSPSLNCLLLTDSGMPKCYEETLQGDAKDKWDLSIDDEIVFHEK